MKNPAEEKKARSSMSSTFGSVMNPDMRDLKGSLEQILKQRKYNQDDSDNEREVVSNPYFISVSNLKLLTSISF